LHITTYLASGAAGAGAGAASLFAAGAAFLALCAFLVLCFIGAGAASVVLAASAAGAAGAASAANAPMLKVAAKTPANNADNNLFISNFLNIKKVFTFKASLLVLPMKSTIGSKTYCKLTASNFYDL
jgi:hypothetical protein